MNSESASSSSTPNTANSSFIWVPMRSISRLRIRLAFASIQTLTGIPRSPKIFCSKETLYSTIRASISPTFSFPPSLTSATLAVPSLNSIIRPSRMGCM